ncbi:MAG: Hpt domain-containing protein [Alphaproteobacteria bacterium]
MDEYDQANINAVKVLLKDKFADVVVSYLVSAEQYVAEIGKGIENKDSVQIENNAHPLKSSSGMMGLMKLRHIADKIENLAVEGIDSFEEGSEIYVLYNELKRAADKGFHKLNVEMETLSSQA